jgi:phospholipid/cholesterol/gamma-HCH transport system substrate-binding protein
MRRMATSALVLVAAGVLAAAGPVVGDDGGPYEVRAIFDNGNFLVTGEEVRIAGARVGTISEVDVSGEDEIVSLEDGPEAIPGKAVVVMRIDDPAFQDFREDASCLIRPQSLLGEKFVECIPTQPRAAGTEPPPPIEEIDEGEPGEGQRLLPLENNGKSVDLDLIQNIQRLPYAERFRIILNELGAGLAARGEDLAAIVERGNPALRQTNRVLAILARQNRVLAQLAVDSDTVLAPLARERERVAGFIENAGDTAAAAAERRGDLAAGLRRLAPALRDVRLTMNALRSFSNRARPTIAAFGQAAPALTRATAATGPLARSATTSLLSLGNAAEASQPKLRNADPILRKLRRLGHATRPAAVSLQELLRSLRRTQGFERIMDFLFFTVGTTNGFDQFGHYLRAILTNNNCNDYEVSLIAGCSANFGEEAFVGSASTADVLWMLRKQGVEGPAGNSSNLGGLLPLDESSTEPPAPDQGTGEEPSGEPAPEQPIAPAPALPPPPADGAAPEGADPDSATEEAAPAPTPQRAPGERSRRAGRALLEFLMGDRQ